MLVGVLTENYQVKEGPWRHAVVPRSVCVTFVT